MTSNEIFNRMSYEPITKRYWYGQFGRVRVVIDVKDHFINATKLCKSQGKQLFHWRANKQTKQYIEALEQVSKKPVHYSIIGGLNNTISGTYVCKELIIHVANWISPDLSIQILQILTDYFTGLEDSSVVVSENINDPGKRGLFVLVLTNNEIERRNEKLQLENDRIKIEKNEIEVEMNEAKSQVLQLQNRNRIYRDDVAPKTSRVELHNTFVVFKKNREDEKYPYYAIRCQKTKLDEALRKSKAKYPDLQIALDVSYNPNPVSLYNRIKEDLPYVRYRGNHLDVPDFEMFELDVHAIIPKL